MEEMKVGDLVNLGIALGTGVLAIITGLLALYTRALAVEAKRARETQAEPDVVVSVEPTRFFGFFDLVIENVGRGTAYDVAITPPEGLTVAGKADFGQRPLFSVKFLKSKTPIRHFIGRLHEVKPKRQKWKIQFKSKAGAVLENEYEMDLSIYDGLMRFGDDPMNVIAKHIEEIAKHLQHLTTGFKRLRVDTYTSADRKEERLQLQELRDKHRKESRSPDDK